MHEGVLFDVTRRKVLETAARHAEERLTTAIESIREGFALFDADDRLVVFNHRFVDFFHQASDVIKPGTPYETFIRALVERGVITNVAGPPERWLAAQLKRHLNPRGTVERCLRDGRWLLVAERKTADGGIATVYADVSELKRRQQELDKNSALLEATLDTIAQGFCAFDKNFRLVAWNDRYIRLFQYPPSLACVGTPFEAFSRYNEARGLYEPGDANRQVAERVEALNRSPRQRFEWTLPQGTVIDVRREPMPGGGVVTTYTDITELKKAGDRARQHEAELARVLRLSTMGEMASALAHEVNQPLAAVVNYSRGCLRKMRSGNWSSGELMNALEQACEQAERASEIVRRVGEFVRKSEAKRTSVAVNDIVRAVAALAEADAHENGVSLRVDLADGTPPVSADMIQIEQVILNLARNAIEAMRETEAGERELAIQTSMAEGNAVEVAVRDTGPGLRAGTEADVFEPFFTTKPQGMGMGLSISRTIAEAHGGRLWASQNADRGVTFRFTLPTDSEDRSHGH